jgi:hypothetical protein
LGSKIGRKESERGLIGVNKIAWEEKLTNKKNKNNKKINK